MRVLLVNDLVTYGGAELQTFRIAELLRANGHEALVLTFDRSVAASSSSQHINMPFKQTLVGKAWARFSPIPWMTSRLKDVVRRYNPDVVHLNNVWRLAGSLLAAVADVPTVQTVRDFQYFCPKGTCVTDAGDACDGYSRARCQDHCGMSIARELKLVTLSNFNAQRANHVDVFLSPSNALAEVSRQNGFETVSLPNPFVFDGALRSDEIVDNRFVYAGVISESKGVGLLLDAWTDFSARHPDARLRLAGPIEDRFSSRFDRFVTRSSSVTFLGKLAHAEVLREIRSARCLVVPSLWLENYPNVLLEAQAAERLVIGPDRGGIPEMVDGAWLFDPHDPESLISCMERALDLPEPEYQAVTSAALARLKLVNDPTAFLDRLLAVYRSALLMRAQSPGV